LVFSVFAVGIGFCAYRVFKAVAMGQLGAGGGGNAFMQGMRRRDDDDDEERQQP
jgi:hypothetical protein